MFAATVPRRGPFHRRGDNRGCPASPSPAGGATTQGCPELGETGGGGPGSHSPPLLLPHRGSPSPSRPVATTAGLTAGPGTGRATGSSATSAGERAGVGGAGTAMEPPRSPASLFRFAGARPVLRHAGTAAAAAKAWPRPRVAPAPGGSIAAHPRFDLLRVFSSSFPLALVLSRRGAPRTQQRATGPPAPTDRPGLSRDSPRRPVEGGDKARRVPSAQHPRSRTAGVALTLAPR